MNKFNDMQFAVVGAGLGGCSIAALLQDRGYRVTVYEQAGQFEKMGAGIHLSPNVVKLLEEIGVAEQLRSNSSAPNAWVSRSLLEDDLMFTLPLGDDAHCRYGSPYLTVHRGEFHQALISKVDPDSICFGKKLVDVKTQDGRKHLMFGDGSSAIADVVIGADGLNSKVREVLRGNEPPKFGQQVVFRGQSPISDVPFPGRFELTKWWASDRFLISYFMEKQPTSIYFVAGIPSKSWDYNESFIPSSRSMVMEHFADACSAVVDLVKCSESVSLWPLFEREPITDWGDGDVVLLGDACHPMRPHMAQGAAMAIEDAALFVRLVDSGKYSSMQNLMNDYASLREPRTSLVQSISSSNEWLKWPTDPDWLYGYDALTCNLSVA